MYAVVPYLDGSVCICSFILGWVSVYLIVPYLGGSVYSPLSEQGSHSTAGGVSVLTTKLF